MTYQTNPITTRLKITRGWFQEYFPQDKLSYSSETLFFYKYYLLTQIFLSKKKVNIIRFSISTDNKGIILAYFSVQKQLIKRRDTMRKIFAGNRIRKYITKQRRLFFKLVGYNYHFFNFKNVNIKSRGKKSVNFWPILKSGSIRALTVFKIQKWNKDDVLHIIQKMGKFNILKSNLKNSFLTKKNFLTMQKIWFYQKKNLIKVLFFFPRNNSI